MLVNINRDYIENRIAVLTVSIRETYDKLNDSSLSKEQQKPDECSPFEQAWRLLNRLYGKREIYQEILNTLNAAELAEVEVKIEPKLVTESNSSEGEIISG